MERLANLEIHKEEFSFSAGHFTIFSATEREHLHGHNYAVSISFHLKIEHNGLSFDYRHYKKIIHTLCDSLDRRFLLPAYSPYLKLEDKEDNCLAWFNHKLLTFPKDDVVILPLSNITIEELSYWFLQKILENQTEIHQHLIESITVKVYNNHQQSAGATWSKI